MLQQLASSKVHVVRSHVLRLTCLTPSVVTFLKISFIIVQLFYDPPILNSKNIVVIVAFGERVGICEVTCLIFLDSVSEY